MQPTDALNAVIMAGELVERYRHSKTPGEVITRSNDQIRQALQDLTSADAANVRDDYVRLFITSARR